MHRHRPELSALMLLVALALAPIAARPTQAAETSSTELAAVVRQAGQGGKEWLVYTIHSPTDRRYICCYSARGKSRACAPEHGDDTWTVSNDDWRAMPHSSSLIVYLAVEHGEVRSVRTYSPGCEVHVTWPTHELTGVDEAASLDLLRALVVHPPDRLDDRRENWTDRVLSAMASHERPAAALLWVLRATNDRRVQRQALFWMAESGDPQALEMISELLES